MIIIGFILRRINQEGFDIIHIPMPCVPRCEEIIVYEDIRFIVHEVTYTIHKDSVYTHNVTVDAGEIYEDTSN